MIPEKLFKDSDVKIQDVEELTDILNNHLNKACAYFYYAHGMAPITIDLIHAFYKLRIKILEIAVRHYEELKDSNEYTISHPEYVTMLAQHQAEVEEAKGDYDYFLDYGKIKED